MIALYQQSEAECRIDIYEIQVRDSYFLINRWGVMSHLIFF